MVAASKVPMLKPGDYELWRMRMEQYIQMVDYSLWEVIKNGNAPPITKLVEGVETIIAPSTAEEKAQRRLELKARSTLLMGIPNEHQLKFNSIKDAKLQILICQLEIHDESISQEDVNQKFLRSLTSSTNGAVNTAHGVTTASTQATAVNSTIIDNLSDAVICTFFASQPNSPQLDNEDLQQINPDDLEEMDLSPRWSVTTATKGDTLQGSAGLSKDQGGKTRIGEHKTGCVAGSRLETTTSNALISCDGLGDYDWSDQAEEGPTNFALMAYSSTSSNSEVSTDSNCSSSCLENFKILKEQNEQLLKDLRTSKINAITYKTGLESVEARLLLYKKNESVYEKDIKLLKHEIYLKEVAITELPKLQTVEDLQGDALLHYNAEIELMNLILLSIPNDIYNYVDACTSAKHMWKRVERLMRGTIQNKVNRETRFTNEFDQFVAEPGEALVSVYNHFAQLMNDLERNDMHFPIVTINTKFLNSLQTEWLEYVTQVHLAKRLTVDTDLQILVPSSGYTSKVSMLQYSGKGTVCLGIAPKPRVRDSKYFMEQMLLAKQDETRVILIDEQNDFLFADASRMEEIEELS
ncbi:hypothetical protein Tco_0471822 [Tanacetum coccineum]